MLVPYLSLPPGTHRGAFPCHVLSPERDPMQSFRLSVLAAAAATLVPATLDAQNRNVALMARWDPGGSFNDIWGYRDPTTGGEYAILLGTTGTYIVDCTNPSAPVQRGFFPNTLSGWSTSSWRDARTYRQYAYVVTEGGGGMHIIDLSNPNSPQFVKHFTQPGVSWNNSHNISLDTQNGIVYPCGTSGGMHIFDIATDPVNPRYIASYTAQYVHDLQVQNGYANLAEINRSTYRILDVRNLPSMTSVGSFSVPSCHNAWPTRDDQFCVTTSERTDGGLTVFNISNRSAPQQIATYLSGTGQSIHNAFVLNRVVHIAYYVQGYKGVDISDPANPVEVGTYDTSTSTSVYSGNWGCYPFQPSGIVYSSDVANGLYVLKPRASTQEYGAGVAGTGGKVPTVHTFGSAYVGNANFGIEVDNAAANRPIFYLVGGLRANVSFAGLTLLVDGFAISGTSNGQGRGKISVPVPNNNALDGVVLHTQVFVNDPAGPLGFTHTAGRTFEVFIR
jgi:choice-of-anchor B domain-containing protein